MRNSLAAALLLLGACASPPQNDFIALSYQAADALLQGARPELPDEATIIYGVFTPVGQPGTSSPFGQMFVELVASRLVQNGVGVVEVRLRDAIAVREGGPYAPVRRRSRRGAPGAGSSGPFGLVRRDLGIRARHGPPYRRCQRDRALLVGQAYTPRLRRLRSLRDGAGVDPRRPWLLCLPLRSLTWGVSKPSAPWLGPCIRITMSGPFRALAFDSRAAPRRR